MSEKMYPIPFKSLMNWVTSEYAASGEVFGVRKAYHAAGKSLPIFGERIETPFGPAAGPNSQLAQNIIAAYFAGARFFELKTVQKMDGAELAACVPRPCILANDEGYNQEWSTELTVPQAMDEYIKAWCALKILAKIYGLGDPDGFVFNMSVGYDLEGIKGEKVDTYLNGMTDASRTAIFGECKAALKELFPEEGAFIDAISPRVSRSVTLSTLHGCPPDEIERIATYLISEKHLHTFVKCNPTILGYETARRTLDSMGYDYIVFDDHHFREDLQWADAVPMFERLQALADQTGVEFGLKLSNTFPVDTTRGELPNDELLRDKLAAYAAKGQVGRVVRVMVLGIPNVGKSTFINKVAKRKTARAEDRPGVTRSKQWVPVDATLELLDTPGILWPRFDDPEVGKRLAFTGAVKDDVLDIEELACYLMEYLGKHYAPVLQERYKIEPTGEESGYDLLEMAGRKRGFLMRGAQVDTERMARVLLDEFRGGKLGRFTLETVEDVQHA